MSKLISWLDRIVPKGSRIVLRTPRLEDQARETILALQRCGAPSVTLVLDDATGARLDGLDCAVVTGKSPRGIWAYLRSRLVLHTHGVNGNLPASGRKQFVNLWHGMPLKRLDPDFDFGRNRVDVGIATAPIHAEHLAETWGIPLDRLAITGLPCNDLLAPERRRVPGPLDQLTQGRPLVVWLPTFRQSVDGQIRADGKDLGTATQFTGADPEVVNELMARHGLHCLVKVHPLARPPEPVTLSNLTIWSSAELEASGVRLYDALAHADALLTDHSSVWIDFLLTERPIIFAMSDREAYIDSRGYYFGDLDQLLPGPIVEDMDQLAKALKALDSPDGDNWAEKRRAALLLHHSHRDGDSADRVAALVMSLVRP